MRETKVVATLVEPPRPGGADIRALSDAVGCLEVRADLVGDLDPDWLRSHFRGELLYTLRSCGRGGRDSSSPSERSERLLRASRGYDLVDIEWELDTHAEDLARLPVSRRLVSSNGPPLSSRELLERFTAMAAIPARYFRVESAARKAIDALAPLALLKAAKDERLTAFATGPGAFYSRILAAVLGAPLVFGAVRGGDVRAGEIPVERILLEYNLPAVPDAKALFGIVGVSAMKSSSPRLHNAAYRALGLGALYLPFYAERFEDLFCEEVLTAFEALGTPLRGMTVTSPHKEAALRVANSAHPRAERVGAANSLVRRGAGWYADTTDTVGVTAPLAARGVALKGVRTAVVGCGGAGRAVAEGLAQAAADVTLCNRSLERGRLAADLLGLPLVLLSELSLRGFGVVVHATPCTERGDLPIRLDELRADAVLVDMVCADRPTPLVEEARARGLTVIDGREVLFVEVSHQFQLMTGRSVPIDPRPSVTDPSVSIPWRWP